MLQDTVVLDVKNVLMGTMGTLISLVEFVARVTATQREVPVMNATNKRDNVTAGLDLLEEIVLSVLPLVMCLLIISAHVCTHNYYRLIFQNSFFIYQFLFFFCLLNFY